MKLIPKFLAVCLVASMATTAFAADHKDGSATGVKADPSTDINDLFVFPNGNNVVLAMTVSPFADKTTAKFSDAAKYVFHTTSHVGFTNAATGTEDVICTFTTAQVVSCWVGTKDYVTGDASASAGITSASGKVKVFAGVRADPFYFYLTGFNTARATALSVIPGIISGSLLYASGCPKLTAGQVTAVQTALVAPNAAADDFDMANTLAITIEIDKTLLTTAADETISVWAATTN